MNVHLWWTGTSVIVFIKQWIVRAVLGKIVESAEGDREIVCEFPCQIRADTGTETIYLAAAGA